MYADDLERLLDKAFRKAKKRIDKRTETRLKYWSSGSFSLQLLRRMDHPYAKRHGSPRLHLGIINVHLGRVKEGWKSDFDGINFNIRNTSHIWNEYLQFGTSKMFSRKAILDMVEDEMREVAEAILEQEIKRNAG